MITIQYNPIVWWVIPLFITLLSGSVASLAPTGSSGIIGDMLGRLFYWFAALIVVSITWFIAAVCK